MVRCCLATCLSRGRLGKQTIKYLDLRSLSLSRTYTLLTIAIALSLLATQRYTCGRFPLNVPVSYYDLIADCILAHGHSIILVYTTFDLNNVLVNVEIKTD